ncbi:MAG: CARDB domain-containing protein [Thermoleophilaceae bacterium]
MHRTGLALGLLCAALAVAPQAAARDRAPASVRVAECQPGGETETRTGAFQTSMRRVRGTRSMQVRLYLLERLGDGRFTRMEAPGLGAWRSSRRGVRRFVYTQRIEGLKARAAYRVVVHHRWIGADGKRIRFARRRSDVCEVQGALPNLRIVKISARDGLYSVVVRNSGGADARDVPVALSVDGVPLPAVTLASLAALETRSVRFTGAPCRSGLSAAIDPDDALRESSEADNVRVLRCRR